MSASLLFFDCQSREKVEKYLGNGGSTEAPVNMKHMDNYIAWRRAKPIRGISLTVLLCGAPALLGPPPGDADCILFKQSYGTGATPLIAACFIPTSTPEVVQLLLDKGADVHAKTSKGFRAVEVAKKHHAKWPQSLLDRLNA